MRTAIGLSACLACLAAVRARAAGGNRQDFPNSIREVPATAAAAAHAPRHARVARRILSDGETAASMTFEVALRMRDFDGLQARIARGETVSGAEMEASHYPLAADHDAVVDWLKGQGLTVTRTDANRLAVFGRGSVADVARAFQVTFARVATDDGEFTSAVTAPSLPGDLAAAVLGIHGLQPHIRPHRLGSPRILAPNASVSVNPPYFPAQIAHVYNADTLSATGAGQTIAIYAYAFPATKDLTSFWSLASITQSTANIQTVSVAGGPATAPSSGYLEEVTLDVEWASSLAPGAKIRIYGASELDPANNDEILQQVFADLPTQPSLHELSISIGGNELEVDHDYLIIEAQYMANLANAGVTVLSASGDSGAYADGILQTTYPTSDPDVTGVGGTSLTLNSSGGVASETAWADSGGGVSAVFSRPPWQIGVGVPAGTMRLVPDVASVADPNTGALFYYGSQQVIGGTSWAAPTWTAFCALINQVRVSAGQPVVGLINTRIYSLIGTTALRDITNGNNGYYSAGVGYDLCTGVGVPNVTVLATAALSPTTAPLVPAQLGSRVTVVGQPATFFISAYGAAPLSYQWQRIPSGSSAWTSLSDNGTYVGSATPMLVVNGSTLAMNGDQFQCIASNPLGSADSSPPAVLAVNPIGATTLAGWPGSGGSVNATGWAARFNSPGGIRADASGNLFVSDGANYTIRKVTPAGVATTVAGIPGVLGSTDGSTAVALFSGVGGVAPDASGNLYVADSGNYTIRKITPGGIVSTLAGLAGTTGHVDGTGSAARFSDPQNVAVDNAGNLYVPDGVGNTIRKVTPAGVVTTLAGSGVSGSTDGTGTAARFSNPTGLAVDSAGNVYVADYGNDTIRKVTAAGVVTTLAGIAGRAGSTDGVNARFNGPGGAAVDPLGNIYVTDSLNYTIREVSPAGVVSTIGGSPGVIENIDGLPTASRFSSAGDITIDSAGVLYIADSENNTIRRLIPGVLTAPSITTPPASQTVPLGASATFAVAATGTAPLAYQWFFNGGALGGATGTSYTIPVVQSSNAGSYTVVVSNAAGSATSAAAVLGISLQAGSPSITSQPQGGTLAFDGTSVLTVAASPSGSLSYQWQLNGVSIAGGTQASYAATVPGTYTVVVTNPVGSASSNPAVVSAASRLVDVSSRALVGTGGSVAIAGIVIDGPPGSTKQVLIRGVGPTLASFGVAGALAQPSLLLLDSTGTAVASNTTWGSNANAAQIAAVALQLGTFALPNSSLDSALLVGLSPGSYTVQLSGVGSSTGIGLVEVYEANTSDSDLLADISTRALVGVGGNILIAGFVVQGTQPVTVLIRAVGPTLAGFGVSGPLSNPLLSLFNSSAALVGSNQGWSTASVGTGVSGTTVSSASASVMAEVGAFALPAGSADAAMIATLPPGAYTAQVTGVAGSTGVALVEVYQAPPQ